jgi:hypothetical protein
MIHRFIDLFRVERFPDIPVLAFDQSPTSTHTIWQIGNRATPYRMTQTAVSSASSIHLGDPEREPTTGDYVVYSRFNITGTINKSVRLVDWANTTDIQLYADATGGTARSLQPTWKPDGSKILFRAKGAGSVLNLLKHMNPDGSGVATIYTGANEVFDPVYSHDGTKIAWIEGALNPTLIRTANADGSSPVTAYTSPGLVGPVAWMYGSNVLGFRDQASLAFTSNERWRIMNPDGTGLTTWLTISRAAGYGPGDGDPAAIMYSFLQDDSAIATTVRQLADPDPDARLTLIDSTGSNLISPAQYGASNAGSSDTRPAAIVGMAEGVERIYWMSVAGSEVSSILPDGSDYRVDWDGSGTPGGSYFHGFRGDTVNV